MSAANESYVMPPTSRRTVLIFKWGMALFVVCGVGFGLARSRPWHTDDSDGPEPSNAAPLTGASAGFVELEPEAAARLGLAVQPAEGISWVRRETVYGRIVANPRSATEIRAPFSGILRAGVSEWPTLGRQVERGQKLGSIDIRVGPEIRLDLQNKLTEAKLRQQGEAEVVTVHTRTVESLKKITAREILSRAELDTAQVSLAEARIQSAIADAAVELWEKSLRDLDQVAAAEGSLWSQPLIAPREGVVTELAGRPGIAVEPGMLLLQLLDFRSPLARLDLPPENLGIVDPPAEIALSCGSPIDPALRGLSGQVAASGSHGSRLARLLGPAGFVDASSQFVSFWYEVQATGEEDPTSFRELSAWQPGLQVRAEFPAGSVSEPGVRVPATAILFHEGRSLVYVRTSDHRYERREVRLLGRAGDQWFVQPRRSGLLLGVSDGEQVVHVQTQVLLSLEFLKQGGDAD